MAPLLNKIFCSILISLFFFGTGFAQLKGGDEPAFGTGDYKDAEQHEKFYKRRKLVGAWQINQLKQGAIVVRLKTNQLLIDQLTKAGQHELAKQKEQEIFAINKNTMFAFIDRFDFCKVYFIYSHYSDSLLNGARSGIFLDTTLMVNPNITLTENFYMLAERDYAYNSSIGFVPEQYARSMREKGNAVKQMAFVIKNKYGHQLKNPFPYAVSEKTYMNANYDFPISETKNLDGTSTINYYVNKNFLFDIENDKNRSKRIAANFAVETVKINRQFTYEKLAVAIEQLNENLRRYQLNTPPPQEHRIPEDARQFFY